MVELLTESADGLTVSEVAEKLQIPVSSAHALLVRLLELGYLRRLPAGRRYAVGGRLARLGPGLTGALDVVSVARPHLRQLAKEVAEDVCLGVYEGSRVVYQDRFEGFHRLRLSLPYPDDGFRVTSAACRLYLARLSDSELEAAFEAVGERVPEDWSELHQELSRVRAQDHSTASEGTGGELMSFAAPIHDAGGQLVAAIVIRVARRRLGSVRPNLVGQLLAVGRTVSHQLGWQPVD